MSGIGGLLVGSVRFRLVEGTKLRAERLQVGEISHLAQVDMLDEEDGQHLHLVELAPNIVRAPLAAPDGFGDQPPGALGVAGLQAQHCRRAVQHERPE